MTRVTGIVRHLPLAAILLSLGMASGTCTAANRSAAATPAAAPITARRPEENIQELEEIWVDARRLLDQITDAEEEFFPIYNKVNKKNDYDITCDRVRLSTDSMIMSRICLPGFLGKDYGAPPWNGGTCNWGYEGGYGGYSSGPCVDGGYEPPSAEFIIMAKSDDLRSNMMKVVRNDPRLFAMAENLGELYMTLDKVRHRYRKAKGIEEKVARRAPTAIKVNAGPRSL